jgi:cation diffusion facilitator family transporter
MTTILKRCEHIKAKMHKRDISKFQHSHLFHYSGSHAEKKTMRVVLLTSAMMFVEIIAGWLFNSMALLADGWHMSTHAAALGIAWIVFILARRYSLDRRFTFGAWKIEVLGGFVSGIFLGVVGLAMAIVSINRLLQPMEIQFNQAILVAVIGLVVNIVSIFFLMEHPHGHSHEHVEDNHTHNETHHSENLNMRAAYLHVLADALTSVLAIAALLGGKFFNWNWLDPMMGILGAFLIIRWTYSLLAETGSILLDRDTSDAISNEVRKAIEIDEDTRISDLHVWKVGQNKYACIIAIVAANPLNTDDYKARVSQFKKLAHVTIEINSFEHIA